MQFRVQALALLAASASMHRLPSESCCLNAWLVYFTQNALNCIHKIRGRERLLYIVPTMMAGENSSTRVT